MEPKTFQCYIVVGTGKKEGQFLAMSAGAYYVSYFGKAALFHDLAEAQYCAQQYKGVVRSRTISDAVISS